MRSSIRIQVIVVALIGISLLLAACGDDDETLDLPTATPPPPTEVPTPTTAPTQEPSVAIEVREWSITTDVTSIPVGETIFVATNSGTIDHEVVFLRTERPIDDLPVGSDNKVNRFAEGIEDLGVIRTDALVPGATVREPFDLPAGTYALICNIPEHYESGMFAPFTIQ